MASIIFIKRVASVGPLIQLQTHTHKCVVRMCYMPVRGMDIKDAITATRCSGYLLAKLLRNCTCACGVHVTCILCRAGRAHPFKMHCVNDNDDARRSHSIIIIRNIIFKYTRRYSVTVQSYYFHYYYYYLL
jgi:hypothetical protein